MVEQLFLTDEKTIRIFSDPIRQRILSALDDRGPLTSSGLAKILGGQPARLHYHLAKLEAVGLVEEDHTELIHGIRSRFMRPAAKSYLIDRAAVTVGKAADDSVINLAKIHLDQTLGHLASAVRHRSVDPGTGRQVEALVSVESLDLSLPDSQALREALQSLVSEYSQKSDARRRSRPPGQEPDLPPWHFLTVLVPKV